MFNKSFINGNLNIYEIESLLCAGEKNLFFAHQELESDLPKLKTRFSFRIKSWGPNEHGQYCGREGEDKKAGREKRMGFILSYNRTMNPTKQTTGLGLRMKQILILQI